MIVLKPTGFEVALTSNTTVANSTLVRVINTGVTAALTFANSGGNYANLTVSNTQYVVVQKAATDTLQGSNMLGVPVAWKN
jgi:hypothetical protein